MNDVCSKTSDYGNDKEVLLATVVVSDYYSTRHWVVWLNHTFV